MITREKNNKKTDENQSNSESPKYVLWLFVSGMSVNSFRAIKNLKAICNEYLKESLDLQILDIYKHTELALSEKIIVVPILIIKRPLPETRIIGDLSDYELVLKTLNLNKDK